MEERIKEFYAYIIERQKFNYNLSPEASTEDWMLAAEMEAIFNDIL